MTARFIDKPQPGRLDVCGTEQIGQVRVTIRFVLNALAFPPARVFVTEKRGWRG
jgi:hypothetical protein